MKNRTDIDPELHILRSVVRLADGRPRQEMESARFNLFASFEARDADAARRWVRASRVAMLASASELGDTLQHALDALATIEQAIE